MSATLLTVAGCLPRLLVWYYSVCSILMLAFRSLQTGRNTQQNLHKALSTLCNLAVYYGVYCIVISNLRTHKSQAVTSPGMAAPDSRCPMSSVL